MGQQEIDDIKEDMVTQQEYDELKALLDALKAAKADVEKERDAFQQEHILLHKKISKLEVDLEGAGNKRDEYKRLLTEAERRIRELEGINARFTDREKELQEELLSVHNEVSGLQQQIILLKIRLSKAEADRGNFEDKIDKLNKEINDLHQRLSQVTSSVDEKDATIEQLQQDLAQEQRRLADLESQYVIMKSEEEKLLLEIRDRDRKIDELERKIQDDAAAFAQLKGQLDESMAKQETQG